MAVAQDIAVKAAPSPSAERVQNAVTTAAVGMAKPARTATAATAGVIAGAAGARTALMDAVGRLTPEAAPAMGEGVTIPPGSGAAAKPSVKARKACRTP